MRNYDKILCNLVLVKQHSSMFYTFSQFIIFPLTCYLANTRVSLWKPSFYNHFRKRCSGAGQIPFIVLRNDTKLMSCIHFSFSYLASTRASVMNSAFDDCLHKLCSGVQQQISICYPFGRNYNFSDLSSG